MTLLNEIIELNSHLAVVAQLNKLLQIDPILTNALVNTRLPVSKEYTQSDEFVYSQDSDQGLPVAGLIGVLNGLVANTAQYRIAASYDDTDKLTGFCLMEVQPDGSLKKAQ